MLSTQPRRRRVAKQLLPNSSSASASATAALQRRRVSVAASPRRKLPQSGGVDAMLTLTLVLACLAAQQLLDARLPDVQPHNADAEIFSEQRALVHLDALTKIGPRPVASGANAVHSTRYIVDAVHRIAQDAHHSIEIEVQIQNASGVFNVDYRGFMSLFNSYIRVPNVVIRLSRKADPSSRKNSLLLGTHFDSYPSTVGASDAAGCVSVLLETLRALASVPAPDHSVIIVLNGAEEFGLQASHGFIAQHEWASTVRAFINLDSGGVGGREALVQSGPRNFWIAQAYAASARHPHAFVMAQDLFQSGAVPSDTDFRVYAEHTDVGGLDMLFYENGYLYHTEKDSIENMQRGSLQHMGDNVLSIANFILRRCADFPLPRQRPRAERAVFFTVLDHFVVCIYESTAVALQWFVVLFGAAFIVWACLKPAKQRCAPDNASNIAALLHRFGKQTHLSALLITEVWEAFACLCIAFIGATVFCTAIGAAFAGLLHRPIAWYRSVALATIVFTSVWAFALLMLLSKLQHRVSISPRALRVAQVLASIAALVCLTSARFGVAYLFAIITVALVISVLLGDFGARQSVATLPLLLPSMMVYSRFRLILMFFVPCQGRFGSLPSDIVIAALVSFAASLSTFAIAPLLLRFSRIAAARRMCLAIALLSIITMLSGPVYTPMTPKRLLIQHTISPSHRISELHVMSLDNRDVLSSVDMTSHEQLRALRDEHVPKHLLQALYPLAHTVVASSAVMSAPPPPDLALPRVHLVEDDEQEGVRRLALQFVPGDASMFGTINITSPLRSIAFDGGDIVLDLPRRSQYFVRTIAGDFEPFVMRLHLDAGEKLHLRYEATSFGPVSDSLRAIVNHLPQHASAIYWLSAISFWEF